MKSKLIAPLSLHDSTLESVEREGDRVRLRFDFAMASLEYLDASSETEYLRMNRVVLECVDAQTVALEYWTDDKQPLEHPDPDHPIDEIMSSTLEKDCLELSGFGPDSAWVVWRIQASDFEVCWEAGQRLPNP